MSTSGGYPPMAPIRIRARRRRTLTGAMSTFVVLAFLTSCTSLLLRSCGLIPVQQVDFSDSFRRDIFGSAACEPADVALVHGQSGDIPLMVADWYRAAAWKGLDRPAMERVANLCLGLRPSLTPQSWTDAIPAKVTSAYGLRESWDPDEVGMVADDAFGHVAGTFLQHTDIHEPDGLARIVYAHRSPDGTQYDLHLYMFNWD